MGLKVVTGASGHIGANLVAALLAAGHQVRALFHRRKGLLEHDDIEWVRGDVLDLDSLRLAFAGADTIFHLAALISIEGDQGGTVTKVNVDGVGNVAQAALESGVGRFIHFSSIHAFKQQPVDEVLDENRARAHESHHNAYDRSKAAGEKMLRTFIEKGLDALILHPTGVIGPFDGEPSRMGQCFLDLYHRKLPGLVDGGFDWVDVRDVVAAALVAEERGRSGENYLLSGHWHSMLELAQMAQEVTGVKRPGLVTPMWLARAWAPFQMTFDRMRGARPLYTTEALEALRGNRQVSNVKAKEELEFDPRPIRESVADIYAWFEKEGKLKTKV
ncbi:MAG: NAD-dependent epimerase/dehydratase family protein [Myxococcota bacterium]|nr:NAD-dependent epimerase/dehydratase family protein [Myxococcota bacterium]